MCFKQILCLLGMYKDEKTCYNSIREEDKVNELVKLLRPVQKNIKEGMLFGEVYPAEIQKMTGKTSHMGIDYLAPVGTECISTEGVVVNVFDDKSLFGLYVVTEIDLNEDIMLYCYYAHLSKALVKIRDKVADGQVIGLSGCSGDATQNGIPHPHLHFEVRLNSRLPSAAINPEPYISVVDEVI